MGKTDFLFHSLLFSCTKLRPPSESNISATNIIIIVPYISFYPQMEEDTENMPLLMDKDKYVTV